MSLTVIVTVARPTRKGGEWPVAAVAALTTHPRHRFIYVRPWGTAMRNIEERVERVCSAARRSDLDRWSAPARQSVPPAHPRPVAMENQQRLTKDVCDTVTVPLLCRILCFP